MAKKDSKLLSKIVMLLFLVMIVLGFTVPGFIDGETDPYAYAEPRVCVNDADCYLTCEGTPQPVLCSQNLCIRNSCSEGNYYPLNTNPLSFTLSLEIENEIKSLSANVQNLFITFDANKVNIFSNGLNLNQVLDKAGIAMNSQCVRVDAINYCTNAENKLQMFINSEESYQFIGYIPKEGDTITIKYISTLES
tara:strand:+ start:10887 stop:11465 length:579 start_codon:yes stop_codon:yes gene_type:complete